MDNEAGKLKALQDKKKQSSLWIQTLGNFQVWLEGELIANKDWGRDKTIQLFQYLVAARHRRGLHKEQIINRIWEEADSILVHGQRQLELLQREGKEEATVTALTNLGVAKELKEQGWKVYAVEQSDDPIWLQELDVKADAKIALVLGNEVSGVAQEVMDICDGALEVPQYGTKHSLNVAVCTGVVVWDIIKKIKFPV